MKKRIIPKILMVACSFQLIIIIAGVLLINFMPGTLGKKDPLILGDGDFTLDMYGWKDLKSPLEKVLQADLRSGLMKGDAVIISNKWFPASHIDHYIAMPLHKDLVAIGDTNDIHQYAWINNERKTLGPGDDAYCIVPSNYYFDPKQQFGSLFTTILSPQMIEQKRNGITCRRFYIWRMKDFIKKQNPRFE